MVLEDDDLQLLMKGSAVGFGTVLYSEFRRRTENMLLLVRRTVQRKMGRSYQGRGRIAKMYSPFIPALSVSEGSFIITLKLVRSKEEQLALLYSIPEVIEEVLVGIDLLNDGDREGLERLIDNRLYRQGVRHCRV